MKKVFLAIVASLLLCSCEEEKIYPEIALSEAYSGRPQIIVSSAGASVSIPFTTNMEWKASVEANTIFQSDDNVTWTTISASSGSAGSMTLMVNVAKNMEGVNRGCYVVLRAENAYVVLGVLQAYNEFAREEGTYKTVTIGGKTWMAENLRTTTFANGDPIEQLLSWYGDEWGSKTTPAWCWYENNTANDSSYGKLYNHYAVSDSRGLCPSGWHIPSVSEWEALVEEISEAGALKESGYSHWCEPNLGADDTTEFLALPGGYRLNYTCEADFVQIGFQGHWWTDDADIENDVIRGCSLSYFSTRLEESYYERNMGASVRCVQD